MFLTYQIGITLYFSNRFKTKCAILFVHCLILYIDYVVCLQFMEKCLFFFLLIYIKKMVMFIIGLAFYRKMSEDIFGCCFLFVDLKVCNFGKCIKYETCAILHRFQILCISCNCDSLRNFEGFVS